MWYVRVSEGARGVQAEAGGGSPKTQKPEEGGRMHQGVGDTIRCDTRTPTYAERAAEQSPAEPGRALRISSVCILA